MLPLFLVFVISRLVYHFALNITFSDGLLTDAWQLLDPVLLRTDLLRSLYYLHCQPPLYNLLTGVLLKVCADHASLAMNAIHLLCGFALYLSIYSLQVKLGVSRIVAFITSTVFIISPACILYENWFFYTYPLALLLLSSGLFFINYLETQKGRYLVLTCLALTLLAGTRSIFHLSWILVVGIFIVYVSRNRRRALLVAGVSLLFVFSLYLKNEVVFGRFTASTWLGMNFWRLTVNQLPENMAKTLADEGKISRIALVQRFSNPEAYPESYFSVPGFAGVPALRAMRKSTGGVNFNHLGWIAISDQYWRDDVYVVKHYPARYVAGLVGSFYRYSVPASDHFGVKENALKMPRLVSLEAALLGKTPEMGTAEGARSLYLLLFLGHPLIFIVGCLLALGVVKSTVLDRNRRLTIAYICFNLFVLTMAINMIERGENNRMRFMLDPLFVVLLGASAARLSLQKLSRGKIRGRQVRVEDGLNSDRGGHPRLP